VISLALAILLVASLVRQASLRRDLETARTQRSLAYEFLRQAENYSTTLETELFQVRSILGIHAGERTATTLRKRRLS
jgi:hypothetical protein